MGSEDYLFGDGDLDATLRAHQGSIAAKIDAIPRDQFMNAQPEEIIDHILSAMTVEPLVIYEDRAQMDQRETKIDVSGWRDRNPFGDRGPIHVSGVAVSVSIPFTGDSSLWKLRPNQWQSVFPHAKVVSSRGENTGHVHVDMVQPTDEAPERFKARLDEELKTIRFYLQSQKQQIEGFNAGLRTQVLAAVRARRDRIQKHEGLQDIMGIPLKRKEGAPAFAPVKIARKLVRPLPPPPKSGYKPEPGITEEDYFMGCLVVLWSVRVGDSDSTVLASRRPSRIYCSSHIAPYRGVANVVDRYHLGNHCLASRAQCQKPQMDSDSASLRSWAI